jgi:hypothetical protein
MFARIFLCALFALSVSVGRLAAQAPEGPPLPPQPQAAQAQPAIPPQAQPAEAAPAGAGQAQPEPQVLEEGPIHEAFAEPIALDAKPRVLINREPPEPINELPPDVRPEGENIEWIPGYWMWSDIQQDFVWVSGVWRDIPPGRRWMPGHWSKVDGGYEWVSGFWAGEQAQEVQLLPHPPASLEVGPSSPAPGDNYFWVPGVWVWQNGVYGWRAGYWYLGQANWVWVPDHYCYTPGGSFFVSGYWDYPLAHRGLLFAPVYWPNRYFGYAGWYYRPYSFVDTSLLLASLFINDRHHHYYFGHGHWRGDHFHPWWDHGQNHRHRGYDPLWAYHRWHEGRNRDDWEDRWRSDFDRRHDRDGRPGPGGGRDGRPGVDQLAGDQGHLVRHLNEMKRDDLPGVELRKMNPAELQRTKQQISQWKDLREARAKFETRVAASGDGGQLQVGGRGRGQTGDRLSIGRVDRGSGGQLQIGANGQGGATSQAGLGRPNATAQAGAGGNVQAQGPSQARLGSPFDRRRATFKLPQDSTAGGGATTTDAVGQQRDRSSWSSRFQSRPGNNVVVPGSGQASTSQQAGQANFGQPRIWQGGRPAIQQGSAIAGGERSSGRPSWSYRSGTGDGGSSHFRSQVPQGGNMQFPQGGSQVRRSGSIQIPQSDGRSSLYRGSGQPSAGSGQQFSTGRTQVYQGGSQFNRGTFSGGGQRSYSPGSRQGFSGNHGGSSQQFSRGNWSSGARQSFRSSGGGGQSSFQGGGGGHSVRGGGGGRGGGRGGDND